MNEGKGKWFNPLRWFGRGTGKPGKDGKAKAYGRGIAIAGKGGRPGRDGSGGDGGSAVVIGSGKAVGGDGGDAY